MQDSYLEFKQIILENSLKLSRCHTQEKRWQGKGQEGVRDAKMIVG